MAEQYGEKTEAPTPRRREEAREQGQIARSADLTSAALLLSFMLLLSAFGDGLVRSLRALMMHFLSADSFAELELASLGPAFLRAVLLVSGGLAPLLIGVVLVAVAMNLVQVGFFLGGKRLVPKLSMLSPLRGLKRLFSAQNLVHLGMNVLKLSLVGVVAWSAIQDRLPEIIAVQTLSSMQAFGLGSAIIYSVGLRIAGLLLALALLDYAYQKYRTENEMRMTKQEVKEEMRRMEGDPKIKQRRRQVAIQMATRRLKKDVPTADVVVTNPTEFAVALKYEAASMHAPRVVAKGQGYMAMRIREIAIAHGVPIVERKPLARALFRMVQVGQEIPEQFYAAVAEILAYVYELTGRSRRRQMVGA